MILRRKYLLIFSIVYFIFVSINEGNNIKDFFNTSNIYSCNEYENMNIAIGGECIGIKSVIDGVVISDIDRDDTFLEEGDILLRINGFEIATMDQLEELVRRANGREMLLNVKRQAYEFTTKLKPLYDSKTGKDTLGIKIKEHSVNIGTITFYDLDSKKFAAIGHAVDIDKKDNFSYHATDVTVNDIRKSGKDNLGGLCTLILDNICAKVDKFDENGAYGRVINTKILEGKEKIEILPKENVREGKARIVCTLDENGPKEYEIEIYKKFLFTNDIFLKVTDETLLKKAGGLVQGMSGSPIIQDGKIIGVLSCADMKDPTNGMGIYIEDMISSLKKQ